MSKEKEEKPVKKSLSPDVAPLQELYELMVEKGLDSLEIKDDESRVKLTRKFAASSAGTLVHHAQLPHISRAVSAPDATDQTPVSSAQIIATPLAGVFYRASSPTSAPFVKEGDSVDVGQTLCIVEAMKVMNEIKAETSCRIIKIVAENGRPLTAGQPLFQFEPL